MVEMRRAALTLAVAAALAAAGAAWSVGPDLPAFARGTLAAADGARYAVAAGAATTTVRKVVDGRTVATARIAGRYGLQMVTLRGDLAGLSADGRTLVLSGNLTANGQLRTHSSLAVLDTRTLTVIRRISLRGDYSVDALSPTGRTLYLIHHVGGSDISSYRVNAYDLAAGRLLPRVIADKRQAGWTMSGLPVARAESAGGGWVYTLYQQGGNYPFVHALDTAHRLAVCIGLPLDWRQQWISRARLVLANGKLEVRTPSGRTRAVLDTATFAVSTK
ncbi:MAG TPA: hypothetical protein VFA82_00375 [Gaiellaceae bacterium]|nr:hypothetical protein [Gaiellaceae bacterium]